MKEFIQKYQKAIVGTGAIAVLVLCSLQQKELQTLRAQLKVDTTSVSTPIVEEDIVDSLRSEIFILETEIGRWELSLQHLYEVNPKVGKEFTQFMEHETE
jgi:hypothetical protein